MIRGSPTRGNPSVGLPLVEQRLGVDLETRDWQLLDRHAAQTGSTLADLARRHLEPLLKRLRQSAG
jgi:hypothetical protein